MPKTLILTDRKNPASDIAAAIMGETPRLTDGAYYENEDYIVFWTEGAVFELVPIEAYDNASEPNTEPGDINICFPEKIKYKKLEGKEHILKTAIYLFSREEISRIITATPANQDGEFMAATLYTACGIDPYGENIFRLWARKPLTKQTVWDELSRIKPAIHYKAIYKATKARKTGDWLYAANISKALRIKTSIDWHLGRLHAHILSMVVEKYDEKETFQKKTYWTVRANIVTPFGQVWTAVWQDKDGNKKVADRNAAEDISKAIANKSAIVEDVRAAKKIKTHPRLLNLTDLQSEASTHYALTAEQTLLAAQNCYEKHKCISIPLTSSRYLLDADLSVIKSAISVLSKEYVDIFSQIENEKVSLRNKGVFDRKENKKQTAIIPISCLPEKATENEKKVYSIILKRFAAVFSETHEYDALTVVFSINGQMFLRKHQFVTKVGWQTIYGKRQESACENQPQKGEVFRVIEAEVVLSQTKKPGNYTESGIIKRLVKPAKSSEKAIDHIFTARPQDVKIGTEESRIRAIEALVNQGFLKRQGKTLSPTRNGLSLIDVISRLPKNSLLIGRVEMVDWEKRINGILNGSLSTNEVLEHAKERILGAMAEFRNEIFSVLTSKELKGACPECHGKIYERQKFYGCENWNAQQKCGFKIWKTFHGKKISKADADSLLVAGQTRAIEGFVSKKPNKRNFNAHLKLKRTNRGGWMLVFEFPQEKPLGNIGLCPDCEGNVYEYRKHYACENKTNNNGCPFNIWKTIRGRKINAKEVELLLQKGVTEKLFGFVNKSKAPWTKYSARLKLSGNPTRIELAR